MNSETRKAAIRTPPSARRFAARGSRGRVDASSKERARREAQRGQDTEESMREMSRRGSGWVGSRSHGPY